MTSRYSRQIQTDQCGPFEEVLRWLGAALARRRRVMRAAPAASQEASGQSVRSSSVDEEFSIALCHEVAWLTDEQRASIEALDFENSSAAYTPDPKVIQLSKYRPEIVLRMRPAPPTPRVRWHWATAATVAGVLLFAAAAAHYCLEPRTGEYSTGLGERRVIPLEDGSIITMNTHSRIRVGFSKQARDIQLLAGEILIAVAHDAMRPLRVHARHAIVQAIGTQFSVYLQREETRVAVVEGRVKIFEGRESGWMLDPSGDSWKPPAPVPLGAGEEAHVRAAGAGAHGFQVQVETIAPSTLERHLAWRDGQISLDGDTLAEAVEAFNRYNRQPIRIADPSIAGLRVGGRFQTMDPESFVAALHAVFGIQADRSAGSALTLRGHSLTDR